MYCSRDSFPLLFKDFLSSHCMPCETQTKVEKSNFRLISSYWECIQKWLWKCMENERGWKKVCFLMLLIRCICLYVYLSQQTKCTVLVLLLPFLFTAEIFCCSNFLSLCDSHSTFMACTMVFVSEDYENMQLQRYLKRNLILARHSYCVYYTFVVCYLWAFKLKVKF